MEHMFACVMAPKFARLVVILSLFLIILIILASQLPKKYGVLREKETGGFQGFNNITGSVERIVPNIVHFVIFGRDSLDFTSFLSILSAMKIQRPEKILVHSDRLEITGAYWLALRKLSLHNTSLELRYLARPTHTYGQPLSSVYHASDVARIHVLMENGGIYLDTDTLILKPLTQFLHFEMTVGWPVNDYLGTQIVVAHKDARFLKLWQNCYRRYHPREWYMNAGQLPTQQILEKQPSLVHRVTELFGVENLGAQLYGNSKWPQWKTYFAVHLLSRHPPAPETSDEILVKRFRTPYGEIARWILYGVEPKIMNIQH